MQPRERRPGQRRASGGLDDPLHAADADRADRQAARPAGPGPAAPAPDAPVRHDVISRTGSSSSRRSANESALRELVSSHCTSSTASSSGEVRRARAARPARRPRRPAALAAAPPPSDSSSAADSALRWTSGRLSARPGRARRRGRPRPAKASAASDWLHRHSRTSDPAVRASRRPAPRSPSCRSRRAPRASGSPARPGCPPTNRRTVASSDSRATIDPSRVLIVSPPAPARTWCRLATVAQRTLLGGGTAVGKVA